MDNIRMMDWLGIVDWLDIARGAVLIFGGLLALILLFLLLKALWGAIANLAEERRRAVVAVLLILVSVLVFLSLFSYWGEDVAGLGVRIPHNLGGVFGVFVADWLLRLFGFPCYFVPLLILLGGVWLLRHEIEGFLPLLGLITGVSIFGSLILSLLPLNQSGQGFENGGIVGREAVSFLATYFGRPGAWLISFSFLVVVLSLFTKLSLRPLAARICSPLAGIRRRRREAKSSAGEVERVKAAKPKARRGTPPVEEKVAVSPSRVPVKRPSRRLSPGVNKEFQEEFLGLLASPTEVKAVESKDELMRKSQILVEKLKDFGVLGEIVDVAPGPVITRYEFEPAPGVRVSSIASLADDLALALKASRIRIEAPIPGKAAVGIEVPNKERTFVYLKEVLASSRFSSSSSKLTVALGKDIAGDPDCGDIALMPHLLIAGATGSGKSVCINSIVASILYRAEPKEVRFIMIDPKMLELPVYNGIPHLLKPVITNAKESLDTLKEVLALMERRYREFARAGVRDIEGYNRKTEQKKPYILVIVDELADLMITAPGEIESILTRLAQMSRAVGIHLILATQRPSVDVITGLIKANFPARIAFQVASGTDSRTILDMGGAEKLLGRGDMLFLPPGKGTPVRLHGTYISTEEAKNIAGLWSFVHLNHILEGEIERAEEVVDRIIEEDLIDSIVAGRKVPGSRERIGRFAENADKELSVPAEQVYSVLAGLDYYPPISEELPDMAPDLDEEMGGAEELDELFEEAKSLVIRHQVASVSLLQRRLKIGYARAGRIIDQLEKSGVIGPYVGSKSREVLVEEEPAVPDS